MILYTSAPWFWTVKRLFRIYFSGISLMVSISVKMLTLTTFVPKALKNKTKGLLGNYDDDPYNDFTLPNGTVLNANITERDIFHYGKTCTYLNGSYEHIKWKKR